MPHAYRPMILLILDGWGMRDATEGNAVAQADTPHFDRLWRDNPHALLAASGEDVGLPEGQIGNSEVGHMNIGAGRVVWMDLPRIDAAIRAGDFPRNPALSDFIETMTASGGTAHVMGLMSPGGVHSHQRHMAETARLLREAGVQVKLHAFTDGRDVGPETAPQALAAFRESLPDAPFATLSGRFYAMDRDKRWERVKAAFDAIISAKGARADTPEDAIEAARARGETDEFITPTVIGDYRGAQDGDALVFINFRADRARQLLSALVDPGFDGFDAAARPDWAARLGMVSYSDAHDRFMQVMFPPENVDNTLAEWVSKHGLRQFHLAETEKYPHVTFFLNGGREEKWAEETRFMAPSPKVRTYDMAPEMSAEEVVQALLGGIERGEDLIVCNFANPDMVGHTGDLQAAIRAVETVDGCLGRVADAVEAAGGAMLVFADHGNCETMIDPETGGPHTAHTLNPAPLILVGGPQGARLSDGRLADVAPTALSLMGLDRPPQMTGRVLLERS